MAEPGLGSAASEYFAAIVESSDDTMIGKDLHGIVTSWNEAATQGAEFLSHASMLLGSTLNLKSTIDNVTGLVVPRFADWCIVDLLGSAGAIERIGIHHRDLEKVAMARRLWERYPASLNDLSVLASVLRTGKARLLTVDEEHALLLPRTGLTSGMIVPMAVRGELMGALTFASEAAIRRYAEEDLTMAARLAERAAPAIDNARRFSASERDRIEALKAVTALRESNADLEQFGYVVGHDLQEPLRGIATYTELLSQRYKSELGPEADQFITYIVDSAARMTSLIDDLLSYSRLAKKGAPDISDVNAEFALSMAIRNLSSTMEETGASITHDPLPRVLALDVQLVQVFQNLIANSLKYRSREQPRVHLSARRDGGWWLFSITDNGIGIDPQYWDKIFGLFKRLHGRQIPGTGIGLTICKKIVEQHGGRIWLASEPGKGTTFFFTLQPA